MTRNAVFHSAGSFDDGSPIAVFPSAITSVFGRTGVVAAVAGDYFGAMPAALTGATQAARFVGATTSGAPATGTFVPGDVVVAQDGKVWVCTVAGSPGTWVDVGGGAAVSYATPAIVLGSSAAAGAASTVIRSDSTIAAFDATSPSTQAFGDAAAVGTAAFAARRDHKHAMPATPVTSINKTGSTALTGAVTLTGGTGVTLTQSSQDISIAATGGAAPAGSTALVYRYTVVGSDKTSIDTGSDTPDAGSNDWTNGDLLEVFFFLKTDDATTGAVNFQCKLNNDGSSIYDRQVLAGAGTAVVGSAGSAAASWLLIAVGASASGLFAASKLEIPNFAGTVGQKSAVYHAGIGHPTASESRSDPYGLSYRSASAITRLAITPNTGGGKFKVGSQLLIYKRLAS